METKRASRKPFFVEFVELTEENLADASKWCKGVIQNAEDGRRFIKVKVDNIINEKQTKGFPGDYLLKQTNGNGFKVYTAKAFFRNFVIVNETANV